MAMPAGMYADADGTTGLGAWFHSSLQSKADSSLLVVPVVFTSGGPGSNKIEQCLIQLEAGIFKDR